MIESTFRTSGCMKIVACNSPGTGGIMGVGGWPGGPAGPMPSDCCCCIHWWWGDPGGGTMFNISLFCMRSLVCWPKISRSCWCGVPWPGPRPATTSAVPLPWVPHAYHTSHPHQDHILLLYHLVTNASSLPCFWAEFRNPPKKENDKHHSCQIFLQNLLLCYPSCRKVHLFSPVLNVSFQPFKLKKKKKIC